MPVRGDFASLRARHASIRLACSLACIHACIDLASERAWSKEERGSQAGWLDTVHAAEGRNTYCMICFKEILGVETIPGGNNRGRMGPVMSVRRQMHIYIHMRARGAVLVSAAACA